LEQAPLQLYGSALVFSPTNSKVRTLLWHQKWPFVGQVKGVLDNWSPILQTLESHKAAVNAIAFSPDGATLASASGDGEIRLWSVATGACKHVLDPFKDIDIPRGNGYTQTEFVVFSKDGLVASSHSLENKTRFWDAATGSLIYAVNQEKLPVGAVCSASFSVDGKTLGWTSREGKVKLWHAEAKGLQHLPECYGHRIVFSPNGKIFATRLDHKVLIWHITGKLKRTIIIEKTIDIYWLAFCPANNGDVLAVSTYGHGIYIWDVARKHLLQKINVPSASELAFSPDGKILAATAESDVWFLDIETGDHMQTIQGPQGFMLNGVAFSPDGKTLAMACSDGKVKLWDVTLVTKQKNVGDDRTQSTFGKVNSVAMSSNGKLAAMASSKAVRLLDLKNWSFTNFIGHDNTVIRVDFSEDEGTLVSESTDDTVRLWDMKGNTRHTVKNCHALAISQDRTTIATTLKDLTVDPGILKIATLDQWKLKGEPEPYLLPLAFSPDGTMLAAMSIEKIFVWDITKSDKLNEISHDGFYVEKPPLVFSPDNRTLAWGVGKSVKLWDWNDNKTREFDPSPVVENGVRNNNRMVQFVAFSPDGATIATTCFMDMMLRLWNSDGLQSKGTFNLNTQLGKLEFCDDASLLLTNRGLVDISGGKVNYDLDSDFPSLFVQDEWIVCGSQKLLWLPTEYRVANVGVSSLTVLLGHQNEGVTMIEFEAVIED
jgi:WD40 repeat protein